MGHLVMSARRRDRDREGARAGIGWVGAQFSNHAGPASLYARMPLAHDMIGLYFAVGNANHLPPWGGIDMLLSTNPIAAAIPAGDEQPIVLDMATTVAAYGKVKAKAQRGETMPEGWMIDREGKPLTDPKRADEGFLLPIGGMGGYKGYGLALIVGLLAGTLNGAAMGRDVIDFNHDDDQRHQHRAGDRAIDLAAFGDVGDLQGRASTRWCAISAAASACRAWSASGARRAQPGDARVARARDGIPIAPALMRRSISSPASWGWRSSAERFFSDGFNHGQFDVCPISTAYIPPPMRKTSRLLTSEAQTRAHIQIH